jgi:myo-inositol-1(or 4)-monophosphatase
MESTATELLDGAVAAARAGGAVLVEGLQRPKQVELKSERASIVTWADVAAQAAIVGVMAVRGGGAWLDGERLAVSAVDSPSRALVCTGIQSDDPDAIAAFGRRIVALSRQCRGVRCVGSPALCLAYVAAGRIDAFLERDATFAWDVGAGALLITEAGGRIEDLDGGPLNLGPGLANVLASNGGIHAALADIVRGAEAMTG